MTDYAFEISKLLKQHLNRIIVENTKLFQEPQILTKIFTLMYLYIYVTKNISKVFNILIRYMNY